MSSWYFSSGAIGGVARRPKLQEKPGSAAGRRVGVSEQLCFSFDGSGPQSISGVELWRERRRVQTDALSEVTGLPIGHAVRLTLARGPVVEGVLFLDEEGLWVDTRRCRDLRLRVGTVDFRAGDVESCVRLD
jgi:hypothetical protein